MAHVGSIRKKTEARKSLCTVPLSEDSRRIFYGAHVHIIHYKEEPKAHRMQYKLSSYFVCVLFSQIPSQAARPPSFSWTIYRTRITDIWGDNFKDPAFTIYTKDCVGLWIRIRIQFPSWIRIQEEKNQGAQHSVLRYFFTSLKSHAVL